MKKTLLMISAVLVVVAVTATDSIAHGGHHGNSRAQIYRATLLPPGSTGVTGPTGPSVASAAGVTGVTGPTGTSTGPFGRAQLVVNKKRYNFSARVRGLAPATVYPVAIYQDADGQGCASTTNTPLDPPAIKSFTTDASGNDSTHAHGKTSAFTIDKTKSYYVKVTDANGATVLCGNLVLKKKHADHGKHKGHSKSHGHGKGHS